MGRGDEGGGEGRNGVRSWRSNPVRMSVFCAWHVRVRSLRLPPGQLATLLAIRVLGHIFSLPVSITLLLVLVFHNNLPFWSPIVGGLQKWGFSGILLALIPV